MLLLLLAIAPPYVGSQACAACHPDQWRRQSESRHAAALRRANPTLAALFGDRPLRERSGIEFRYSGAPNGMAVNVAQGPRRVSAILEWAFGAGAQAITPVGQVNGRYFEHRISWYREPGQPARTLGHPGEASTSPEKALGIAQEPAVITRCFGCHATGVKPGPDLSNMQAGVTCERCHGPGAAHAAKPAKSNIRVLTRIGGASTVQMCAECHRSPTDTSGPSDPGAVRYQPVGLAASKCYQANGSLSCVTCHDAHSDAEHDSAGYVKQCVSCHAATPRGGASCRRDGGENCLPCHMPRSTPFPYLSFTDHRIGLH